MKVGTLGTWGRLALAIASIVSVNQAQAQAGPKMTFRDIEYAYPRDERLDVGRKEIARLISVGSSIGVARQILSDRGARCRKMGGDGVLRCFYSAFDSIDNNIQDVYWSIKVNQRGGLVDSVDVERYNYGS